MILSHPFLPAQAWPDPTQEMRETDAYEAIWQCIKTWDISVPQAYSGYCGATGNHVRAILDALNGRQLMPLSGYTEAQRLGISERDYKCRLFPQQASFTCPIPPMLNEQIRLARTHWAKSAQVKKQWTNDVAIECRNLPTFEGPVWIQFDWQLKKFPNVDGDNASASAKYLLDGLVQAGIIPDDSLKVIMSPVVHYYRGGNNEVIVTLSSVPFSN